MRLTFHGAARQVTGSCFGFEVGRSRFLVDCGLFQGGRATRAENVAPFAQTKADAAEAEEGILLGAVMQCAGKFVAADVERPHHHRAVFGRHQQ